MQNVFELDENLFQDKIYTEIHSKIVSPTSLGSSGVRKITVSNTTPSGGNNGDIWIQV